MTTVYVGNFGTYNGKDLEAGDKLQVLRVDNKTGEMFLERLPQEQVTSNVDYDPLPPSLGEVFVLGFMADLNNSDIVLTEEQRQRLTTMLSK